MVKRILLLILALFISGCISQKDAKNPTQGETSMAFTRNITWQDKEPVKDTKMNTMTANDDWCYDELQLRVRTGPNGRGSTVLASGKKSGSLSSDSSIDITINFNTDSELGDPDFNNAPRVVASLQIDSGYEGLIVHISNITDSGFTAHIVTADGNNQTSTFTIHWHAIGEND